MRKAGHPLPERSVLAPALAAYVYTELPQFIRYREPGEPRPGREGFRYLDGDGAVSRVAASAARYALRKWSEEYVEEMQRRGAEGGRKSKRGPSKATADNLVALAALPDSITIKQAATTLGVSDSTVKRMRQALRERGAASAAAAPQTAPEDAQPRRWQEWALQDQEAAHEAARLRDIAEQVRTEFVSKRQEHEER